MAPRETTRKQLITAELVAAAFARGERRIAAPPASAIVTPEAWSRAREFGVSIDRDANATSGSAGGCERTIDPSGVVLVKGQSVTLGRFEPAGPGRNVGLLDVITREQGSPMSAGFMRFGRADAFAWKLDYDEVDYVIEGVLHITIDGRVVEGHPGDVLFIPKGSSITFGTPNCTRVFYVTYPAEWAPPAANRP